MKNFLTLLLFVFLFSCSKSYDVEISETYNNGNKKYLNIFEVYGSKRVLIQTNHYLSNGILHKSIKFLNGKKISEWIQNTNIFDKKYYKTNYYTNGSIQSQGFEIDGVFFGPWEYYSRSGLLLAERYFYEGNESDIWFWYDSDENIKNFEIKNELKNNGQLLEFDSKQSLIQSSSFKNGLLNGMYKSFFSNNIKKNEGIYASGKKDGIWKYFFKNNKTKLTESYSMGHKDGEFNAYFEDGTRSVSGKYMIKIINGKQESRRLGTWTWYDNEGNISFSKKY